MRPIFTSIAALAFLSLLVRPGLSADPAATPSPPPSPLAVEAAKIQDEAKKGNERALGLLAELRRAGLIHLEKTEALSAAQTSAKQHNPLGLFAMAQLVRLGDGVDKDPLKAGELAKEAVAGLLPLAQGGDVWAQFELGLAYSAGLGVEKQPEEAVKWFRKTIEQGFALGQAALGRCYLGGIGVKKDPDEAFQWLQKAADQGFPEALLLVGHCYLNGLGVGKSAQGALTWYTKSAEAGLAEAQYTVATCYSLGRGTEKNMGEAAKWFAKAAEQGHVEAQTNLGYCYKTGNGMPRNVRQSLKWLRLAGLHGSAVAQVILGNTYLRGEGVARDVEEGKRWLFMATNSTNPRYRRYTEMAAKTLARLAQPGAPAVAPPVNAIPRANTPLEVTTIESPTTLLPETGAKPAQSGTSDTPAGSLNFIAPKLDSP